jgi:mercuric reductase
MSTRMKMIVEGMTCDSCNRHVADALRSAGVSDVEADWHRGEATFAVADDTGIEALKDAVDASGYTPRDVITLESSRSRPRTDAADGYDLVVLGAGSAAFAASIRARDLGARVAVAERATIGGTCVNVGCVPSKALLRAGEIYHAAGYHPFAGIQTSAGAVDLRALVAQKDELVAGLRKEKYEDLVREYGFELLRGEAHFANPDTIVIDGRRIQAGAYVVATGASPAVPPIPGLENAGYLTSTTALDLEAVPGSLAVIGANAIGLELGQFFAHVGAKVIFFDILDRIAPFEEPEISETLAAVLRDQGAEIHTPAQISRIERQGDRCTVVATVDGTERRLEVDQILVATGRRANTARIGADVAGIELDTRGAVLVDEYQQTSNPKVFAAGDVTPAPQFVYVAAHQGALAADNALNGRTKRLDLAALPRVTFTSPQIAAAGLTEQAAREAGHSVNATTLPLSAIPRALVNRDTRGLVKIVADETTDKVLGVHVLAEAAGEVIQAAVYAIKFGLTTTDLAETWSPYLTMAEGLKLAAQSFTRDVAMLSCCAA